MFSLQVLLGGIINIILVYIYFTFVNIFGVFWLIKLGLAVLGDDFWVDVLWVLTCCVVRDFALVGLCISCKLRLEVASVEAMNFATYAKMSTLVQLLATSLLNWETHTCAKYRQAVPYFHLLHLSKIQDLLFLQRVSVTMAKDVVGKVGWIAFFAI